MHHIHGVFTELRIKFFTAGAHQGLTETLEGL